MRVGSKRSGVPANADGPDIATVRLDERTRRNRTNKVLRVWRDNVALRACSLAARGLWLEMIFIMHESGHYGHLAVNGRAIDARQLARMVGGSEKQVSQLLDELFNAGVYELKCGRGFIYAREMMWNV